MYFDKVTSKKGEEIRAELAIEGSILKDLAETFKKRPISKLDIELSDSLYIVTSPDFDIISTGENYNQAIDNFIKDILGYALDYFNDYETYFNSPNRTSHMSSLFKILLCKSKHEIALLFHVV